MLLDSVSRAAPENRTIRQRRVVNFGQPGLFADGQPDLERGLRRQFVELEGRQQANHPMRDPLAGFGQAVVGCGLQPGSNVDSPPG